MSTNCFRFAPRDSVPGLISKICKYLKEHPGWSIEELKEAVGDIVADLGISDVSYFTSQSISDLNINDLYNAGYRFVFIGVQGAYTAMYALEKSDENVIANGVFLGGDGETTPSYPVTSVNGDTGAVKTLRVDPNDPGIPTDPPVPINATTLGGKGAEFYATVDGVNQLLEQKADMIVDSSSRAVSHELYAQDGGMEVTLYGKTAETGTGNKSPDNPYVVSGVDSPMIQASGKNMLPPAAAKTLTNNFTFKSLGDGSYKAYGTAQNAGHVDISLPKKIRIPDGDVYLHVRNNSVPTGAVAIYLFSGSDRWADVVINTVNKIGKCVSGKNRYVDRIRIYAASGSTLDIMIKPSLEFSSSETVFEPYNSNSITPTSLLGGTPLMGDGTVDDELHNLWRSGYDNFIVYDGSEDEDWLQSSANNLNFAIRPGLIPIEPKYPTTNRFPCLGYAGLAKVDIDNVFGVYNDAAEFPGYTDIFYLRVAGVSTLEELRNYLRANPLTVYYRSNNYNPKNDITLSSIVRRWGVIQFDSIDGWAIETQGTGFRFYRKLRNAVVRSDLEWPVKALCNWLPLLSKGATVNDLVTGFTIASNSLYIRIEGVNTLAELKAIFEETPLVCVYPLESEEVIASDPIVLRKPSGVLPVTVSGSSETAVTYSHETKHYIDSHIAAAVSLALNG